MMKSAVLIASLLVAAASAAVEPAGVQAATTFTVTSVGDAADLNLADTVCDTSAAAGSQCTLRAAIQEANDTAGPDTIRFVIKTGASAIKVISPGSPLPQITDAVTINGYTQAGASVNTLATGNDAVLRIVLNGIDAGVDARGLDIQASGSVVRGLVVNRFDGNGVHVSGDGNDVRGNFIGTNTNGTQALGNDDGVFVFGSDNVVGGAANAARNVISGNRDDGVHVFSSGSTGNRVEGNYIGLSKGGDAALPNASDGVQIENAQGSVIGGTSAGARNVISGNTGHGLHLRSLSAGPPTVQGNFIGTDATGTVDLGNGGNGIEFVSTSNTTIGGTIPEARNVISGNTGHGLQLVGFDNTVQGNFIGTDLTGTLGLGNDQSGIQMFFRSVIGGAVAGAGNVISDNGVDGIRIGPPGDIGSDIVIQGNRIGTKLDGSGDLGNAENGVNIFGHDNTVGGPGAAANVIAGNDANGVRIASGFATGNVVTGNILRGNAGRGARIEFGPNRVGGGNVVFSNGSDGVVVLSSADGVDILANQIFGNGGLGINLSEGTPIGGVTANDTDDVDTGANERQNFPAITSAIRDVSQGFTTVTVSLNSNPITEFRVDVFIAAADPSGHGEGQFLAHTQTVTTNAGGDVSFSFASTQIVPGHVLTATAINTANRNTSEFSQNRTVTVVP